MVYFVRTTSGPDLIKIGQTRHPRERMLALQRDCPCEIELLCCVPGRRDLEMRFHARFFAEHVRGEWFNASDDLLACIALMNGDGLLDSALPPRGVKLYGPQAERLRAHA